MEREIKAVSFNLEDPFENNLYMFALSNGAFSKYIKRLIQRDQEGMTIIQPKYEIEISKPRGNVASFI